MQGGLASNGEKGFGFYIEDDGNGFTNRDKHSLGIGLKNVRERLNLAYRNVSFSIITDEGKGTRVSIEIMN